MSEFSLPMSATHGHGMTRRTDRYVAEWYVRDLEEREHKLRMHQPDFNKEWLISGIVGVDDSFESAQEDTEQDITGSAGESSDEDEEWDDITGYDTQNSRYTTVADRN